MGRKNRNKKGKPQAFDLDSLGSAKSQNAMIKTLSNNKGVVLTVLIIFLMLVFTIVTNFLMVFNII